MTAFTPQDYLRIFSRRKWLILIVLSICVTSAWALAEFLPKRYKSSTLIVVESQKIPETYVRGVVTGSLQERLGTIRQLVLSRKILTKVIEEVGLPPERQKGDSLDDTLESLRKNIEIATSRDEAFSISYRNENPVTAMKVTAKLAELFIAENLRNREQLVERATEFLLDELNTAKQELEAKEKAISEFKLRYMGELPGQLEANLRALDRLQAEVATRSEILHKLNDRLDSIEKAIKEYQTTGSASLRRPSRSARLKEMESRLATLSATYKDTYPDIILLKEEIAKLKSLPPESDESEDADPRTAGGDQKASNNPILRELLKQEREVQREIDTTREALNRLNANIKLYETRVENTPAREQQLATLMRDYDNLQRNYQTLLDKRLNARIAENLERKQQGEQFRVIDPANLPDTPEWPDKFRFIIAGFALGCGLGFGSSIFLEQLRVTFHDAEEAERILGIPVVGTVPDFSLAYGSAFGKPLRSQAHLPLPAPQVGTGSSVSEHATPSQAGWKSLTSWGKERTTQGKGAGHKGSHPRYRHELNFVARWRPASVAAEQYRVTATRLVLMSGHRKSTVVLVTSTLKGEGKTSSALNLAYVLAHDLGKSTLVIDCDLKQPTLSSYAGLAQEPGLAEVLRDNVPISSCLQSLNGDPLSFLAGGAVSKHPVQLRQIEKLESLLETLRDQHNFIVLDTPPIYPLADVNMLANMADLVVVVIRAGNTPRDAVKRALSTLKTNKQEKMALLTGVRVQDAPLYLQEGYYIQPGARSH